MSPEGTILGKIAPALSSSRRNAFAVLDSFGEVYHDQSAGIPAGNDANARSV